MIQIGVIVQWYLPSSDTGCGATCCRGIPNRSSRLELGCSMCGWSASGSAFTRGVVNGSGGGHPRNVMESDLSSQENILMQYHSIYKFPFHWNLKRQNNVLIFATLPVKEGMPSSRFASGIWITIHTVCFHGDGLVNRIILLFLEKKQPFVNLSFYVF